MTVGQIEDRMTVGELAEWMAYAELECEDHG